MMSVDFECSDFALQSSSSFRNSAAVIDLRREVSKHILPSKVVQVAFPSDSN